MCIKVCDTQIAIHTPFNEGSMLYHFLTSNTVRMPLCVCACADPICHLDPTRIHWGDTVALGHLHANDFVIGAGSSLISTLTKSQIVTATKELNADSNKFFIIREPLPVVPNGIPTSAHTSPHEMSPLIGDSSFQLSSRLTKPKPAGVCLIVSHYVLTGLKPIVQGTAITCNSTIRLLHARTGKYLSSYFDAVPDSQEQEVHLNGDKAIGDTRACQFLPYCT